MGRLRAKHADRREQIVAAAARLFFARSYETVSIRDLEQESGISRGALYYYFADKEEIYAAVVMEGLRILRTMIAEAARSRAGDPAAQLAAVVRAYGQFFEEQRPIFDTLVRFFFGMRPGYTFPEPLLAEEGALVREILGLTAAVIEEGKHLGVFRCADATFQAMALWGLMSTVIQMTDENERTRAFGLPKAELDAQLERYVLASVGTVGRNT